MTKFAAQRYFLRASSMRLIATLLTAIGIAYIQCFLFIQQLDAGQSFNLGDLIIYLLWGKSAPELLHFEQTKTLSINLPVSWLITMCIPIWFCSRLPKKEDISFYVVRLGGRKQFFCHSLSFMLFYLLLYWIALGLGCVLFVLQKDGMFTLSATEALTYTLPDRIVNPEMLLNPNFCVVAFLLAFLSSLALIFAQVSLEQRIGVFFAFGITVAILTSTVFFSAPYLPAQFLMFERYFDLIQNSNNYLFSFASIAELILIGLVVTLKNKFSDIL